MPDTTTPQIRLLRATDYIEALFGLFAPTGQRLLLDVINEMGLNALSDDAIIKLAELHRGEEERQVNAALRKDRDAP